MWLPTPLYKQLPLFWLLAGILIICGALYLTFEYNLSLFYASLGTLSCIFGVVIFRLRIRHQKRQRDQVDEQATENPN